MTLLRTALSAAPEQESWETLVSDSLHSGKDLAPLFESNAAEIDTAAARLAREVADAWTARTPDKPRFVAGVLGPTSKTASISPDVNDPGARNTSFDELVTIYREATRALIAGGADLILIETDSYPLPGRMTEPRDVVAVGQAVVLVMSNRVLDCLAGIARLFRVCATSGRSGPSLDSAILRLRK